MKYIPPLILSFCLFFSVYAKAQQSYKYRISLADKSATTFSLSAPNEYLSEKALLRRAKQQLPIDSTDLPVCKSYVDAIRAKGAKIIATGKWNNTVTVSCKDTMLIDVIATLPFVHSTEKVWSGVEVPLDSVPDKREEVSNEVTTTTNYYGPAARQIEIHNGQRLHEAGFKGQGITIAVIDAGFNNVDKIKGFERMRLLGTHDFVQPGSDIYSQDAHGEKVLSCMACNLPYSMVGTAPEALYWLLRTEDSVSENLVEQDYWAAAVEFADSVGADVVNTSLGYKEFDDKSKNYTHTLLNGHFALISRSAGMAASKGMVVVCSAGNEGNKRWKKITPPADAFQVITVAAVDSALNIAPFSSHGFTADGRVKPDVSAMGRKATVLDTDGTVSQSNGTSFAAPVFCGLVACLWQACPNLTAKEVIDFVRESGDRYQNPDSIYGYGIPDVYRIYQKVHGLMPVSTCNTLGQTIKASDCYTTWSRKPKQLFQADSSFVKTKK